MWKNKTVSVVLPTFNEKDSIQKCIEELYATGYVDEVIVVNNNAVVGTTENVQKTKAKMFFERKQGYGYSCRKGLSEASGDLILLFEPDGTFLAGDVVKFLAYSEQFDVIFGTRTSSTLIWSGANMGLFLRLGNIAVAKMVEWLFNTTLMTDVGCTFKLFTKEALMTLQPQFKIGGSHFGIEMILLTIKNGFRFIEIPVNYMERVGESSVTGSFWKAFFLGMTMIWNIFLFRIKTVGTISPPLPVGTYREIAMDAVKKCPHCGTSTQENTVSIRARDPDNISTLTYTLCNCNRCNTYYAPFVPTRNDFKYFYFSGYHGEKTSSGLLVRLYRGLGKIFLNSKLKKIEKICADKGTLLDIGCGDGSFVKLARKKGWDAFGVDQNLHRENISKFLFQGTYKCKKICDKRYDVITLWHVFEHLNREETDNILLFAHNMLKDEGVLLVSTPNINSLQARFGKGHWFHLDLPRHQIFYPDQVIKEYFSEYGLDVVNIGNNSMEYELSGWVQTLLNMTGSEINYLYKKLKRTNQSSSGFQRKYSFFILMFLAPFLFIIFFFVSMSICFGKLGAVQEVFAVKNKGENK